MVTVTQTSTSTFEPTSTSTPVTSSPTTSNTSTSSTNTATSLPSTSSSGLSKGGIIAIAVVVPIAVIALLAILAFFFWRRNRDKKARLAARKGEIEDYGFDPNAMDGGTGGPGPSSGAALGGLGAGALAGTAAASSAGPEMRQTYGEDDSDGYRGWGPTSSNNKRPGWVPPGAATEAAGLGTAAAAGGAAAAYYGHHRSNSNGAYESYPPHNGENYYYPDENVEQHEGPPDIPPKSYDRYDPAYTGAYAGASSNDYHENEPGTLGVVNSDVQRQPSNASSRYSTVSTDENAGRSFQGSPRQQTSGFQPPANSTSGRPGRSTMGTAGANYDAGAHGGRYDAVNF